MSVSNPTAGDVHVNRPLTNFAQKYLQDANAFVAMRAFPNLPVSKQSDLYGVFDRADFYRDEADERADGTESKGSGFNLSTNPYYCRIYAFHKKVTDRQRANQDEWVNLDQSASQFVTHKLLIRRERLFLAAYLGASIWGKDVTGVSGAGTPGTSFTQWDQSASDPIVDVRYGMEYVQSRTGYRPNKMLLSRQVWNKLVDNDAILARITGGSTKEMPAQVLMALVAQLFELQAIYVADAVYNSAKEGATESTAFMAGKHALLYYAPDSVSGQEPTAGCQFSWTGFTGATPAGMRIKRFREEKVESDIVEGQMSFDYKVTGAELGFFFSGAVA